MKKKFIEYFYFILNINQKIWSEINAYFISSPIFLSTSNILRNARFRTRSIKYREALIQFLACKGGVN